MDKRDTEATRTALSDSDLVGAIREGDQRSFGELVGRLTPPLYALAYRVLEDRSDAEEALQDIFLKIHRGLDEFDRSRELFPWAYTIAINHLRSVRRRRSFWIGRDTLPIIEELLADAPTAGGSIGTGATADPETAALTAETRRILLQAIAILRPVERRVFSLRQYEGLSTEETARVLRLPANTVKTHLRRARKKVAEKILEDETSSWIAAYSKEKGDQ